MSYEMTCKPDDSICYWVECTGDTLAKAKREASVSFKGRKGLIMIKQSEIVCEKRDGEDWSEVK